jgi:hypothetical protein
MQVEDRLEKAKKAVELMIEKWPQYVRLNPRRKTGYPEILILSSIR